MPCSTPCCSYESDFCAVVGERPGIPLKANYTKGCLSAFIWMRIQSTMHNCSKSPFSFNRGLLLFIFWTRAESDCLHIRLTISIVLRFVRSISTIHPPFKLVCRQSPSALVQKTNNNNPLFILHYINSICRRWRRIIV